MCHTLFFFTDFYVILSLRGLFSKLKRCLAVAVLCLFSLSFFRRFLLGTCPSFVLGFS